MTTRKPVRWAVSVAVFLLVTVVGFVPIMFALADTPLHDGDELPSGLLLGSSAVASAAIGAVTARLLHHRLRGLNPLPDRGPTA